MEVEERMRDEQRQRDLLELYGPLVGASALVKALGFKTYAAFHRARRLGNLPVPVFDLSGRRGPFARTTDIADWLDTLDDEQHTP